MDKNKKQRSFILHQETANVFGQENKIIANDRNQANVSLWIGPIDRSMQRS